MWATSTCPPRGALAGLTFLLWPLSTLSTNFASCRSRGFAFVRFYDKHDAEVSLRWMKLIYSWKDFFSQYAVDLLLPGVIYETWTMKTICFQLGHARCFDSLLKVMWLDSWTNEPRVAETVTCLRIFLKLKWRSWKNPCEPNKGFGAFIIKNYHLFKLCGCTLYSCTLPF